MNSKYRIDSYKHGKQVFLLDYAPVLIGHATALIVFMYCDELKDSSGVVEIPYKEFEEHLKISSATIREAFKFLCENNLMERIEKNTSRVSKYKITMEAMSKVRRKEVFGNSEHRVDTCIRRRMLDIDSWPMEYQRLVDKKCLREALKALGVDNFNLRNLIDYFKLDKKQARLFVSSSLFTSRFRKLRTELMTEQCKKEIKKESGVKVKKPTQSRSTEDHYEILMALHLDKEGKKKPTTSWKAPELLRYFCLSYEKVTQQRYVFHRGGLSRSLSCREMGDMKRVLDALSNNAEVAVEYIDWAFREKHSELPDGLGTGILHHNRMINAFNVVKRKIGRKGNTRIDNGFKDWLKENAPSILNRFELEDLNDLYWIKVYHDENIGDVEAQKVLDEAIRRQLIPTTGEIVLDER